MNKKVTEWIIPISCILLQYQAVVSTYGIIVLVIFVALHMIKNRCIKVDKQFLALASIIAVQEVLSSLCFYITAETVMKSVITIFLIVIATSLANTNVRRERVILNFKVIGIICAVAIFLQTFMYIVWGIPVKSIMILPQDESVMHYWTTSNVRACGFFTEPQTYCSYMLPLLIICIERKEYKLSVFLTASLFLTGSSLGILMAAIIWLKVFRESDISVNKKLYFLIAVLIGMLVFMKLDIFSVAREKISTIYTDFSLYTAGTMINSHSYSNYLRLIKGWVTFAGLPILAKILGVGINGLIPFMSTTGIRFSWSGQWGFDSLMLGYYTSAAGVFLECGIIVAILYYLFIANSIRGSSKVAKNILIIMLIQSFTTQMFFNGIFTFYFLLYYLFTDKKNMITIRIARFSHIRKYN